MEKNNGKTDLCYISSKNNTNFGTAIIHKYIFYISDAFNHIFFKYNHRALFKEKKNIFDNY